MDAPYYDYIKEGKQKKGIMSNIGKMHVMRNEKEVEEEKDFEWGLNEDVKDPVWFVKKIITKII